MRYDFVGGIRIKRRYISLWELEVEEVSNNFWEGTARRNSGNIVACQGLDPEEIMNRLEIDFWGIELKLTKDVSNPLSTYLMERATYEGQEVCLLKQPEHFGSWIISTANRQVIYDGKEQLFVLRPKNSEVNSVIEKTMKFNEITPKKIIQLYSWLIG